MLALALFSVLQLPSPEQLDQNKSLLEQQLQSSSPDLRINAIQKLRDLRFSDSLPKFLPLLDDVDSLVRFETIRAISKIQTQEAITALQEAQKKEKDPYLLSEMRRSIRSIEDFFKSQEEAAQKALKKTQSKKSK